MTGKRALGGGIVALTVVMGVVYWIHSAKTEAKTDNRGMANPTQCRNEDGDWGKIPSGSYKDRAGDCIIGTPPAPPTSAGQAHVVRQLPDHYTPCTIQIYEINDLYTDGDPVYMLPPGWSRSKAILYSGKGHLVVEGGNIHVGQWEFWSADDSKKAILIRVFGK